MDRVVDVGEAVVAGVASGRDGGDKVAFADFGSSIEAFGDPDVAEQVAEVVFVLDGDAVAVVVANAAVDGGTNVGAGRVGVDANHVEGMRVAAGVGVRVVAGDDLPGAARGGGQRNAVDDGRGALGAEREHGQDAGKDENGGASNGPPDRTGRRPAVGGCHGSAYPEVSGWPSAGNP